MHQGLKQGDWSESCGRILGGTGQGLKPGRRQRREGVVRSWKSLEGKPLLVWGVREKGHRGFGVPPEQLPCCLPPPA